jgi:hypothetical protein
MEPAEILKFMKKQIAELEKATYMFETMLQPRYAADKKILEQYRAQYIKLDALLQKMQAGEEITLEQMHDCVPVQFR